MALTWLDMVSDPRFSALDSDQRRRLRDTWVQDKIYSNPYADQLAKDKYANWFKDKTEYAMEESFNPVRDKDEGWSSYMKAFSHGVLEGASGGWLAAGGREKLYNTPEEKAMMESLGLPTEKKTGWIDDAEDHPWISMGGEMAGFVLPLLIPLGFVSKVAYIPKLAKGAGLAARFLRSGVKGAQIGAAYGLLKKPEGPEWEHLKSPLHAPWSEPEYIKQKVSDILWSAGMFSVADVAGTAIGAAWKYFRLGKPKKALREMTEAANAVKKTGKLKTDEEAMYFALNTAREAGLEMPTIVEEVASVLGKRRVPKEEVPKLIEKWLTPTKQMGELKQLDEVFMKLSEMGGTRLVGSSRQLELLQQLREAHPNWSEEQLVQGVFNAIKEGKGEFVSQFGERWVPKFEFKPGEKAVSLPSRMGKEDLQSMTYNIMETLEQLMREGTTKKVKEVATNLYDKVALLGGDIIKLNDQLLQASKLTLESSEKQKLFEWILRVSSASRGARLLGSAPKDVLALGGSALDKWHGLQKYGQLMSKWTEDIARDFKFLKDDAAKRRIFYYINDALDLGQSIYKDFGVLAPQEKAYADILRTEWDKLWQIAKDAGIIDTYRVNYAPLIWRNHPKQITEWVKTLDPMIDIGQPTRPMKRGLSSYFRHAQKRKIELEDGLLKGLRPIEDPVALMKSYQQALYRSLANKNLTETLQALRIPFQGNLVPILAHWKQKLPGTAELAWRELYINGLGRAKIAPQFYNQMKDIFDPWIRWYENPAVRAWSYMRNKAKRVIMYNPLIHGANVFSDVLAEQLTVNPISWFTAIPRSIKTLRRGAQLWKARDKVVEEFVLANGNLEGLRGMGNELFEGARSTLFRDLPEGTFLRKVFSPLSTLESFSDTVLWGGIVRNGQLGLYEMLKPVLEQVAAKQGATVSKELIQRSAAHYINDLLGTLPTTIFSPFQREVFNNALFARNWTISNLRLITGALGWTKEAGFVGTKDIFGAPARAADVASGIAHKTPGFRSFGMFDFLRHGGIGKEGMELIQQRYVKHLIKGVFALVSSASLLQMGLIHMFNTLKEKGVLDPRDYGPTVPVHGVMSNPAGRRLDVFTGITDPKGRPIYMSNFLFRYIRDYFSWMVEPSKTLLNKWEPLMRGVTEVMVNQSIWRREPITPPGKEVDHMEWLKAKGLPPSMARFLSGYTARLIDGGKYILESATPADQLWGTPGYDMRWWEYIPHFGGSYVKKGVTLEASTWQTLRKDHKFEFWNSLSKKEQREMMNQFKEGLFKEGIARKLLEYRQRWDYEKSEIDKQIDEHFQNGQFDSAFDLIKRTGRYTDTRYLQNRMRRYMGAWKKYLEERQRAFDKLEKEKKEKAETPNKELAW